MIYRKKMMIEAFQLSDAARYPEWFIDAISDGYLVRNTDGTWTFHTLEGEMTAASDDWAARGVKGELYPIRSDIFAETYEAVPE